MEHRDEALSTRDLSSYAEPQPATYTDQHPTAVTEPQAQPTAGREFDDGQDGSHNLCHPESLAVGLAAR
jgi:hypothetical protein